MRKNKFVWVGLCFIPIWAWGGESSSEFETNWPQWRGPRANGVAPYGNPPVEWSESKNIKWKIEIPGEGHATPIVWNDLIFVLSAVEVDPSAAEESNVHKFEIFAINRADGKIVWQRTAREELPHEGTHPTGTLASNSPITDGEHLYAYFGSRGLYCYDMQGHLKWKKDLGDMTIKRSFGEGSSPALYNDKVVVNWDHEGQSFIIVLDKKTGKELWRMDRDEKTSWATPLVVESGGKPQIITSATSRVRSYDLESGELLWESSGMTQNVIPSPVTANGMVYVMSGFRGNALQAVRLSAAKGDISGTNTIVWTLDRDTPYTPSPLLYDDMLYFLKGNDGVLSCYDASSGEEHFSGQSLEGIKGIYASPVGASGRVYIASRNGSTQVIKHGRQYEVLATNTLDDGFSASLAIVRNEIFLRGHKNLYCIAEK